MSLLDHFWFISSYTMVTYIVHLIPAVLACSSAIRVIPIAA